MRVTFKLLAVFLATTVVLLAIEAYATFLRERTLLQADLQHEAETMADTLRGVFDEIRDREGAARARELLAAIGRRQLEVGIRLVPVDAPLAPEHRAQLQQRQMTSFDRDVAGARQRATYATVADQGWMLEILQPLRERDAYLVSALAGSAFMAVGLGIASLGLFVPLGLKLIGRPLSQLTANARAIGRGEFPPPLPLTGTDELTELAATMNLMSEQVLAWQRQQSADAAERLAAVEKLRHEDRLRTVGQLASEVAHELGTPLNVVSGRSEQIASGQLSTAEVAATAKIIKQQSQRMARIVRRLLDFAHPRVLERSTVDLVEAVREVIGLLEPIARRRHVELCLESDAGILASADVGGLEQVLVNLLTNAMDAMPRGGTVSICLHRKESAVAPGSGIPRAGFVRIDVRDQGEGIRRDDLDQLFEPYFSTKEAGRGSGLGLSIARSIMQEHGGWIDVASELGKGSCFSVYLPARPETAG